jgi:hypothetical protein
MLGRISVLARDMQRNQKISTLPSSRGAKNGAPNFKIIRIRFKRHAREDRRVTINPHQYLNPGFFD